MSVSLALDKQVLRAASKNCDQLDSEEKHTHRYKLKLVWMDEELAKVI